MPKPIVFSCNLEQGTAGIASASQLVESTSDYSIEFGASSNVIMIGRIQTKPKETSREDTRLEKVHKIVRAHKEALDKLDDA